jgi:hypothetical protein
MPSDLWWPWSAVFTRPSLAPWLLVWVISFLMALQSRLHTCLHQVFIGPIAFALANLVLFDGIISSDLWWSSPGLGPIAFGLSRPSRTSSLYLSQGTLTTPTKKDCPGSGRTHPQDSDNPDQEGLSRLREEPSSGLRQPRPRRTVPAPGGTILRTQTTPTKKDCPGSGRNHPQDSDNPDQEGLSRRREDSSWGNQGCLALARSAQSHERFGGVSSADRKAPIRASVATASFKLVRTRISIGWLFLFNAGIPQNPTIPCSSRQWCSSPCTSIQIITMLGVMLILCNGQCPQLFRVYYFRALCAVTEGASAKKPWWGGPGIWHPVTDTSHHHLVNDRAAVQDLMVPLHIVRPPNGQRS